MRIAVIGMGKIGLPLAVQYARKGHDVIGVDINTKTIDLINKGLEPFPEEEHLQEYLHEVIRSRNLRATASYEEAVSDADVIVVVVPLFINEKNEPDFTIMDAATSQIGKYLKKDSLICFETTLPIGTTRNRLTKIIENESKLRIGKDFNVVFSPERVYTGRIFEDLKKYPKIVGGVTSQCGVKGEFFYNQVLEFEVRQDLEQANGVWKMENCETAEFVKLAETTYRDVNIALANQFANFAENLGVNIFSVIEACNSQSTSHIHQPGISVGGHCIPVYPHLYLWGDKEADIVRIARNLNAIRPVNLLSNLQKLIDGFEGKKILLLGLSYRPNVKETAYSGALTILDELFNQKAEIQVEDPLFTNAEIMSIFPGLKTFEDHEMDAIIIHTEDKTFLKILQRKFRPDCVILDGRGLFRSQASTTFYTFDKLTSKP